MPAGFALATHKWHPPPQMYKDPSALDDDVVSKAAMLKKTFRELDANHDGRLTFNELRQLLNRGQPGMGDHDMRILFKHVDRDRSGLIEFDEFVDFIFSSALEDPGAPSPVSGQRVDAQPPAAAPAPEPMSAVCSRRPVELSLPHLLPPATASARRTSSKDAADVHPSVVVRRRAESPQSRRVPHQTPPRTASRQSSKDADADSFGIFGTRAEMHEPSDSPGGRSAQRPHLRGESRDDFWEPSPLGTSQVKRRPAARPRTVSRGQRVSGTL